MAASESTSKGRRGPELRNTWQRRSSTQQGGEAWGHRTRDSVRAHLGREARSEAEEHVAAPELNSARRRGPGARGHVAAPELTSAETSQSPVCQSFIARQH
jgi:hypothetical protein